MRRIKAKKLVNGHHIINNGGLIFSDSGEIIEVLDGNTEFEYDEYFDGYVCPGFINSHCHLELSHLKGKLPEKTGLVDFVISIMKFRNMDAQIIQNAMREAEKQMIENGIVAVGDISNDNTSFILKSEKNIYYHTFLEALGFTPDNADKIIDHYKKIKNELDKYNLKGSITPHAPYSVSQKLFNNIAEEQEVQYSLHHLETEEEKKFLNSKSGDFLKLYQNFGIDISFFNSENSYVDYWLDNFPVKKLLLVHNTFMSNEDLKKISSVVPELYICLCPIANQYIEDQLPDVKTIMSFTDRICIGTDSLASNHQLSILEEIKVLHQNFNIEIEKLLQWATVNGAEFLNIDDQYGSFIPQKNAGILFVDDQFQFKKIA